MYPTAADHREAWRALAREIAARRDSIRKVQDPASRPATPGALTIIGSGIETLGFTLGDEDLLRDADKVFFCVADPATVVWIKRLRPDAFDLYVLYHDRKPRYVTYMQMAEAMLHYVRNGRRVVCVFYGHPGIFVLATHRAILIARREGHQAVMRPGVSALDCLCADLGVDPSHPGMQTHEATDMLIRRRKPDTTLHVVLWQVGLIGEMGYRRQGYLNRSFSVLIEYLQQSYGNDYEITHYIASRYPTIPPLIERSRLSNLHDPAAQSRVNGLSTFYLAPRDATSADAAMAERIGLLKPGQTIKTPGGALREIGNYGARELKAFDDFRTFEVPDDYQWQAETEASKFVLALRQEIELQRFYADVPEAALSQPRFSALTAAERRNLATRDGGAIQVAAKGTHRENVTNHGLIQSLLTSRSMCVKLLGMLRTNPGIGVRSWLANYAANAGLDFAASTLAIDLAQVQRRSLLPWTGVYAGEQPQICFVILANREGRSGLLYVNGDRIRTFKWEHGALEWRTVDGNPTNGFLRFDATGNGRKIIGRVWDDRGSVLENRSFEAIEVDPDRKHLGHLAGPFQRGKHLEELNGSYCLLVGAKGTPRRSVLHVQEEGVLVNNAPVQVEHRAAGNLVWSGGPEDMTRGSITFLRNPFTDIPELYGHVVDATGAHVPCTGFRPGIFETAALAQRSSLPEWLLSTIAAVSAENEHGPLFLWHKWEKHHLTSRVVHSLCSRLHGAGSRLQV